MKKFVTKISFYSLLVIAIAAAIVATLNTRYGYKYWSLRAPVMKKELLQQVRPKGLILGSSHIYHGVNSLLIDSACFNAGSVSQCLYEDYQILKYVATKDSLEYVIVPVSYFTNFMSMNEIKIDGERERIFDYQHAYHVHYPVNYQYVKDFFLTNSRILQSVMDDQKTTSEPLNAWGNRTNDCQEKPYDISDSTAAFERHNVDSNFTKLNPYFDSIINLTKAQNIRLVFIVPPYTSGYVHYIEKTGYNKVIDQLSKRATLIDCRNLFPDNQTHYFRDADHVSPCGRDSFSRYLGHMIFPKDTAQQPVTLPADTTLVP